MLQMLTNSYSLSPQFQSYHLGIILQDWQAQWLLWVQLGALQFLAVPYFQHGFR